jgi:hypothetical protein
MKLTDPHVDIYRANPANAAIIRALLPAAESGYLAGPLGQEPWSPDALIHSFAPDAVSGDGSIAGMAALFANVQCARAGWPLWKIDREIAEALLRTDPAPWSVEPLPYPGMYIEMPRGLWEIENAETGNHPLVGIYLAETSFWNRRHNTWGKGTLVLGVGAPLSASLEGMDDALVYSMLSEDGPTDEGRAWPGGFRETWVFVRNFLYALRTRNLAARAVEPKLPKSSKKQKRAERQGRLRSYSVVELTAKPAPAERRPPAEHTSDRKTARPHVRRAHFRHYWTLEAEQGHVAVQERGSKPPLYRVARWIHMTHVGGESVVRPVARVR